VVVWAHNAHIMNAPFQPEPRKVPLRMAGQPLRAALGANEVIIGATSSRTIGWPESPSDSASFDAALATVGRPDFVLDLRTSDRTPEVASMLKRLWPFRQGTRFQPIVPREAVDAIVYFDQVTMTKDH
jgi:hypothetical protein